MTPTLIISSMLFGKGVNSLKKLISLNQPIEVDHLKDIDLNIFPKNLLKVIHLGIDTYSSIANHLKNKNIPLKNRLHRLAIFIAMNTWQNSIAQIEKIDHEMMILAHPEVACDIYYHLHRLPKNVTKLLIENEDPNATGGKSFRKMQKQIGNDLPIQHPKTIALIAKALKEKYGKEKIGTVLDRDHLQTSLPHISIKEASNIMKPTLTHISGLNHKGATNHEILDLLTHTKTEYVTLEGPSIDKTNLLIDRVPKHHIETIIKQIEEFKNLTTINSKK